MANSSLPQEMKTYFACDPNGYQIQLGAKKNEEIRQVLYV